MHCPLEHTRSHSPGDRNFPSFASARRRSLRKRACSGQKSAERNSIYPEIPLPCHSGLALSRVQRSPHAELADFRRDVRLITARLTLAARELGRSGVEFSCFRCALGVASSGDSGSSFSAHGYIRISAGVEAETA